MKNKEPSPSVSKSFRRSESSGTISIGAAALIGLAAFTGCALEEPAVPFGEVSSLSTGPGTLSAGSSNTPAPAPPAPPVNGLTAPNIVSPLPGASTEDSRPTLTVENASSSDGSSPTYEFQVSTTDGFQALAASVDGHDEGGGGRTSWRVTPELDRGRYFWRARARGASGPGPFSPISDFTVGSGGGSPPPPPPPSGGFLFDPLTNGSSVGQVGGGRFVSSGWQVTSRGDFIRYRVSPIRSGFVEWENRGLTRTNPQRDLFSLFGMWDPTRGDYRENPFRVHVRKLDTNGHNPPYVRLRFISNGEQHDVGNDFLAWDPNRTYRWRVEWGPGAGGNVAKVFLDGRELMRTGYGPAYAPEQHWIELGIEERAESIIGVIYRNVNIGRR